MNKKMSHKEAEYRASTSKVRRCGTCAMYSSGKPATCSLVESPIRPYDLCDHYEREPQEAA